MSLMKSGFDDGETNKKSWSEKREWEIESRLCGLACPLAGIHISHV